MQDRDEQFHAIAATQYGAATREQAGSVGLDRFALRRRVRSGDLIERTERVLVIPGAPDTFELRATVGLLDAGDLSAISAMSGASLYQVPGFEREPIQILRRHVGSRPVLPGVEWVFTRYLPIDQIAVLPNGLRIAVPARGLADLAAHPDVSEKRAERAFDSALGAQLVTRPQLDKMALEWCQRGRTGSSFLHKYLDSRPKDWIAPPSSLQRRFMAIIKDAGFPEPRSEVNLGNDLRWIGRVDCVDPELPLIAEIDSVRFHIAPLDQTSDAARDEALLAAGFVVVRFKEHEVRHKRDVVVARWRDKRNELLRSRRFGA